MSTPKEKLEKNQALNTKKKKFFRILQSANFDNDYCATVNERLKNELEAKMKLIVEQFYESNQSINPPKESDKSDLKQSITARLSDGKRKKLQQRKTFKSIDIIYGLNQTLKLVQSKQLSMVWLDRNVSTNLLNVLHKLCSVNKVFCFDLDLENLKKLFNLSTLSVIGFRTHVQQDESIFNTVYQFLINSIFKSINDDPNKNNKEANETSEQQSPKLKNSTFTKEINYYFPNSSDKYSEVMRERLKCKIGDKKDDFRNQISFIAISHNEDLYFPNYKKESTYQLEIDTEHKLTKEQSIKSANTLAEKLFGIDQIDQKIVQFQSPNLIKGQIDVEKSNSKRKRKSNKKNNKNV